MDVCVCVSVIIVSDAVKPVWVTISGAEKPLSAGKAYTIECTAGGSRPAANIHWYLHSTQQPATERVSLSSNSGFHFILYILLPSC